MTDCYSMVTFGTIQAAMKNKISEHVRRDLNRHLSIFTSTQILFKKWFLLKSTKYLSNFSNEHEENYNFLSSVLLV
jgi:hypothetical protein